MAMIDQAGVTPVTDPRCGAAVRCIEKRVDCGAGTVGTITVEYPTNEAGVAPAITFRYAGPNADKVKMQQYVWRQVFERSSPKGSWKPMKRKKKDEDEEPIILAGETSYCLTRDIKNKRIHYDLRRDGNSIAPVEYAHCRSDSLSKICSDAPSAGFDENDMKRTPYLDSIANFETFFEVDEKACAHISWIRTNKWDRPNANLALAIGTAEQHAVSLGRIAVVGHGIDTGPELESALCDLDAKADNPWIGRRGEELHARPRCAPTQGVPSPLVEHHDLDCGK
jgi:hypothetical protein